MMLRLLFFATALAARGLATLQDLADCDPLKKDSKCPPDPAFAGKASFDFTASGWDSALESFWSVDEGTQDDRRCVDFGDKDKGAVFGMWEAGQAPTLTSNKYLFFGKVSVEVQAAEGQGVITAIVLKSDTGDEIDWELLGSYEDQAQSNYFYDGEALFNTYNDTYQLDGGSSTASDFHTYAVEWTESLLAFSIDGAVRKTWRPGEIPPRKWPQTPMQLKLGLWAVDPRRGDDGEVAWAGGPPDWDAAPFRAFFRSVRVEDYMGSCAEADGDVEYLYDERTRGWEDVRVRGCRRRLSPGMFTPDVSGGGEPPQETGGYGGGGGGQPGGGPATSEAEDTGATSAPATTTAPGGTSDAGPSETGSGYAPPEETGGGGEDGGDAPDKDKDDMAPFALGLSSPLAAVICLGWLLIL